MIRGRPPMHPVQIREYLVSRFEDYESADDVGVSASRFDDLATSITESWLKDRQRAIAEAKGVPF